jgi:UDP-N-acetylmuramate: L-alanyl-gamma-D-glutamyl-meso-diaminopimelate ligase
VLRGSLKVARVEWGLIGEHNQLNALAAIAAAEHVGVTPEQSAAALATSRTCAAAWSCAARCGIKVYDDFAHHPTAMRTTINGLRRRIAPAERILAAFEPRSNTMKLGTMKAQLPWALEEADLAFCNQQGLAWDAKEALAPMGARPSSAPMSTRWWPPSSRPPAGRPCAVHEQRRLRRHPREAAPALAG